MRAFEIQSFGVANIALVERPDPVPGPGQVLVRLHAASLNFRDHLMIAGLYNPKQKLPLIPLSDGVGDVVAVGPGVDRKIGERVLGCFFQRWHARPVPRDVNQIRSTLGGPLDGCLATHVLLDADAVVKAPDYLSNEEAATLPCAALTAWSALVTQGQLSPGEVVVVQGTGGVSLFALQISKLCGAQVIITSSSDEKLERARALGADWTINYRRTPEWGKAVRDCLGGLGADHIVEVGGGGTVEQSLRAVRPGGTVSVIGVLAGPAAPLNLLPVLMQNVRLQGVLVGTRTEFEAMNRAFAAHQLRPVVDRTFDFEAAPEAVQHLASGGHFGKVTIRIP